MRQVSKSGTDVNLTGLFAVYKDFEPSMVMTIVPPSRKAIFKVTIRVHLFPMEIVTMAVQGEETQITLDRAPFRYYDM